VITEPPTPSARVRALNRRSTCSHAVRLIACWCRSKLGALASLGPNGCRWRRREPEYSAAFRALSSPRATPLLCNMSRRTHESTRYCVPRACGMEGSRRREVTTAPPMLQTREETLMRLKIRNLKLEPLSL
jgi:hypothetical protein